MKTKGRDPNLSPPIFLFYKVFRKDLHAFGIFSFYHFLIEYCG